MYGVRSDCTVKPSSTGGLLLSRERNRPYIELPLQNVKSDVLSASSGQPLSIEHRASLCRQNRVNVILRINEGAFLHHFYFNVATRESEHNRWEWLETRSEYQYDGLMISVVDDSILDDAGAGGGGRLNASTGLAKLHL